MLAFRLLTAVTLLCSLPTFCVAESIDDIVQRHEQTVAELNCYRVDVRARPCNRPWGTEYDNGFTAERSGDFYKSTTTNPGMITDAWGNNPIQSQFDITLSNGTNTRALRLTPDQLKIYEAAIATNDRITMNDPAYNIRGTLAPYAVRDNVALMNPTFGYTLAQLVGKSSQQELDQSEDLCVIRCTLSDYRYEITIDPARNYMISNVAAEHVKGGDTHSHEVKRWTQVNGYHLPLEIENKSSRKVGNTIYEYANWQLGDAASTPLELKFINGSKVYASNQVLIWGANDEPETSFKQNDAISLALYEKETQLKYGRSKLATKAPKIAGIVGIAIVLLIVGYRFKRHEPTTGIA